MNELLKWGLILGGGYLAYNWFVNSKPGVVVSGHLDTEAILAPVGGGTATNPKTATPTPPDIMVTNTSPGFNRVAFGMSGLRNYVRIR